MWDGQLIGMGVDGVEGAWGSGGLPLILPAFEGDGELAIVGMVSGVGVV